MVFIFHYYQRLTDIFVDIQKKIPLTDHEKNRLLLRMQAFYESRWLIYSVLALSVVSVAVFFVSRPTSPDSYYIFQDQHPPGYHSDLG